MKSSKDSMFKTNNAYDIWVKNYQYQNETPIETFIRVANDLASVEVETPEEFEIFKTTVETCNVFKNYGDKIKSSWAYKFLKIMVNFDIEGFPIGLKCTPGGRITANAGTNYKNATYLNCFINAPVKDAEINYKRSNLDNSIKYNVNIKTPDDSDELVNIFLTIMEHAKILSTEAGVGQDVSYIRPRGSVIKGTGILHPGVIAYLEVFDEVANCIVRGVNDGYVDKLKNYFKDDEFEKLRNTLKKQPRKGAMLFSLNCFSDTTLILTNLGWINVCDVIQMVENNEDIYAIDDSGSANIIKNPVITEKEPIYEIETVSGEIISVTSGHKFEVKNIITNEIYLKAICDIDPEIEELKIISGC